MHVVVVESPAKAKTINKYLGSNYTVLASYGHVRDLPAKDGSVQPEENFAMNWEVDTRGDKRIKEIAAAVRGADQVFLATDPDREGEAISWHLVEELTRRRALTKNKVVKRVVFNEITKAAVLNAFKEPRELNQELIDAYLARRALDYLVGFTLSPVLWRKLPGSRSAGRVQSVALRLICERESEIEAFKPQEYWTVEAGLDGVETQPFTARLTHLNGTKLDRFDLGDEDSAAVAVRTVEEAGLYTVRSVDRRKGKRNPYPPFTTSTLQQEASRKLGFGTSRTMRIAQKLYEGYDIDGETIGLITYMRTDGVTLSNDAIASARGVIGNNFGERYLPSTPRLYKTKAKNAQEAHEAIRPTDFRRHPKEMARYLNDEEFKLYDLIWKRALSSQMESAELDQVKVDIDCGRGGAVKATLRANGSVVTFDGFLTLYQESRDDEKEEGDRRLPPLNEGQDLHLKSVKSDQHFTQPPPRFTEASLVKTMEELGIGRPSTYASILQVLQDREYVRLEKKRFEPEDRGRVVTAFLINFFKRYVEYNFTAELEEELDDISGGRAQWQDVLRRFWTAFSGAVEETKGLRVTEVIEALDDDLGHHFFPVDPEKPEVDPRRCPSCENGRLGLKLGRTGGFVGCSNYPECRFTRPLTVHGDGEGENDLAAKPRELGLDPKTDLMVTLRKGPYGVYVQLGEAVEKGNKPKRVSLPKGQDPMLINLEKALSLLSLPRSLGTHEDQEITAGIGRFGPYVKKGSTYKSIPKDEDVLTIGLNRAVDLLAQANTRGQALKTLGEHPEDQAPVTVHSGRYGPYVKHGKLNASLPKDLEVDDLTMDRAVALLKAQAEKKAQKAPAKKKAAPKKAAAKKAPTKKTAAQKAEVAEAAPDEDDAPF